MIKAAIKSKKNSGHGKGCSLNYIVNFMMENYDFRGFSSRPFMKNHVKYWVTHYVKNALEKGLSSGTFEISSGTHLTKTTRFRLTEKPNVKKA